ncbi:hypothetical protein CDD81_2585 [Ophiocordyceps australis]|uniref:Uncharacterized protein n=1 Tax=Ophiocordyceps australis TaxID=1399860 RepID=A0A2C5XYU1_9HYPO|nr:hypothetical protein CDD81_2585 [Ophiocordyceps australis]
MQTIALLSVGNLGKYMCDELLADGRYQFIVISRQSYKGPFFEQRGIDVRRSDYTCDSILDILNDTSASTLISFNNSDGATYIDVHRACLDACRKSNTCKRFIPSEFAGNIDHFPNSPSYFTESRVPFREILRQEKKVEWTILNNGWIMDYCLPGEKKHMPSIPDEFPIDPDGWKACIRGTGDEVQSFTSGQDIARALIRLLAVPKWEPTTYITGQWSTFNDMVAAMEKFYGRPMPKTFRSQDDIHKDTLLPRTPENMQALYLASVEEMMLNAAGACPREKTLRQREEFFADMHFTRLEELLSEKAPRHVHDS